jgi:hypothetical protein
MRAGKLDHPRPSEDRKVAARWSQAAEETWRRVLAEAALLSQSRALTIKLA